jgi:hypothetical protein
MQSLLSCTVKGSYDNWWIIKTDHCNEFSLQTNTGTQWAGITVSNAIDYELADWGTICQHFRTGANWELFPSLSVQMVAETASNTKVKNSI